MSMLPPRSRNREPFAMSAPLISASTKRSTSAATFEPSASMNTLMSPVAAFRPARMASPLPLPGWPTTRTLGNAALATSTVPSTELPSTRITSYTGGSSSSSRARFAASLRAGTITLTVTRCSTPFST